jgi:hypothetical protein
MYAVSVRYAFEYRRKRIYSNTRNQKNEATRLREPIVIWIRTRLCIHEPHCNDRLRQYNSHISMLRLIAHSALQFLDKRLQPLLLIHNGTVSEDSFAHHIVPIQ